MGVSDIEPGEHQRAAVPRTPPTTDGRQFAIEAPREVAPHLLDRLFDDIVVVQQPFGRRRDCLARLHVGRRRPVDAQDFLLVLLMSREEIEGSKSRQRIDAFAGNRIHPSP